MKLLEIGLSVVLAMVLYGYVSGRLMKGRRMLVMLAAGAVMFGLHAILEGLRVQMILVYGLYTICVLIYSGWAGLTRRIKLSSKPRLWWRITFGSLGLLTMVAALLLPLYVLPTIKIVKPTGDYAVGTADYHWIDESRAEHFTAAEEDKREIVVRIWYPAEAELTAEAELSPYAYDSEQMGRISEGQPLFIQALINSMVNTKSNSYLDVPISAASPKYPVLLLSPGYGATPFMYTSLTENLASHGYIVVAIEHSYYSMIPTVFADGRVSKGQVDLMGPLNWERMEDDMQLWVEDIRFIIEQLDDWKRSDEQGNLIGRMDLDRIGLLGHSFGGAAAAQVMKLEPRILAGVNMDGFPYGSLIEDGLAHPFLHIQTQDSQAFGQLELPEKVWSAPAQYGIATIEEYHKIAAELNRRNQGILSNGGVEWVVSGADHMSFSDTVLYSPLLGKSDPSFAAELNDRLLLFFEEHVRSASLS